MLLYIIRHGDPDYENDSLTPKGKLQADALAKRLALHGIDKVYCSPLGRAKLTAKPTCELLGLDCVIEPWTSESKAWEKFSIKCGDGSAKWVFHQQTTLLKNDQTIDLGRQWHEAEVFAGLNLKKGYDELAADSDGFLLKLGYRRQGSIYQIVKKNTDRVAVFCHQGFGVTWMSHLLQIPPHLFWSSFDVSHSSISLFEFENNADGATTPKCLCLSDTSHIYKEGLPLRYNNILDI
ncbi:MAG: histidine phosphatase family protein [Clostridiales bacterium]|jgi:probable phosphoglycerate mutase|nr:histidine phosphatase family protein [Clostridiales bacterium]